MAKSTPRSPKSTAAPATLLERSKGASIAEMQNAMGSQAHSVRGFLAGTVKKMPIVILVSEKLENKPRRYRIDAAAK